MAKCPNHPGEGNKRQMGVCHVCAMRDRLPLFLRVFAGDRGRQVQSVGFCARCCHWFCTECWRNVAGRVAGFIEQHVHSTPGCCGPEAEGGENKEEAIPRVEGS